MFNTVFITMEESQSFAKIKDIISSKGTLAYVDSRKKMELHVDAGPHGLGVILTQRQQDGTCRPITYASCTLSTAERNYSQLEKEALAVRWGCKKLTFI